VIAVVAAAAMQWLVLNDIHLNPYDARPGAVYGSDTNPALLNDAIREMRTVNPNPAVIVLGGDFLAHHFPALARARHDDPYRDGSATIRNIARSLNRAFPRAQFLVTLGNNDDPCGDYHSEVGGPYAREIARAFAPLVDRNGSAPDFERRFAEGGYYTARLPGGVRAVVLNSVLWSFVYRGSCQQHASDPGAAEQRWFARALQGGPSVVVMHVPPGFDAQSTTVARRIVAVPFLSGRNDAAFRKTLREHANDIGFILGAHTHRYDFRVPGDVPMLIASSLSPVYRNNPAFYALTVAGSTLVDAVPYVDRLRDDGWIREPSFDATYGTKMLDAGQLRAASDRIAADTSLRATWVAAYDVWSWRIAGRRTGARRLPSAPRTRGVPERAIARSRPSRPPALPRSRSPLSSCC
jgi:hypothetical protein